MTRILDGVDGHGRSSPEKQHMQTIWIQRPRSPLMPLALEAASPRRQTLRQNHSLREDVKKKNKPLLWTAHSTPLARKVVVATTIPTLREQENDRKRKSRDDILAGNQSMLLDPDSTSPRHSTERSRNSFIRRSPSRSCQKLESTGGRW